VCATLISQEGARTSLGTLFVELRGLAHPAVETNRCVVASQVALCGRIVEAEPTDSGLALTVEDGTGRIRTKQWYATNDDGSTNAAMKEALDAQAT
jgi:Lon protease-like protein